MCWLRGRMDGPERASLPHAGSCTPTLVRREGMSEHITHSDLAEQDQRAGSRGGSSRSRRHAQKLVAAGLCVHCKSPHDRGTRRCAACTAKAVATNRRTKQEAKASSLCVG